MTVVADSSPLIVLAKIGCFELLHRLFPRVYISAKVYDEVVVSGAGLPGASEVAEAQWIEVKQLPRPEELLELQGKYALGPGEISTILLAKHLGAVVLLDDYLARKIAEAESLQVLGTVGLLETFHVRGHLTDLRAAFRQLLMHSYIDRRLLDLRLQSLGIPAL